MQGKDLKFEQITVSFLNKLTTSHFEKVNTHNGLAVYMRTIRAIYNKAIQVEIIDSNYYPIKDYTIVACVLLMKKRVKL